MIKILNLDEMMKIKKAIECIEFSGYINEEELSKVGVEFKPVKGETRFNNIFDEMVLTHMETGLPVKQIMNFVDECIANGKRVEDHWGKIVTNYSKQLYEEVKIQCEFKNRIEELEKELAKLKGVEPTKKKRGRKPKAKTKVEETKKENIDLEERDITEEEIRVRFAAKEHVEDEDLSFGRGLINPALTIIEDSDIQF